MQVLLSPSAQKSLKRINEPIYSRIKSALLKLESEPPHGDIKSLTGKDGYRLRVGDYRILFDIVAEDIIVTDIKSRGKVYKR
jgi:mRNA interferase RelE/StbE